MHLVIFLRQILQNDVAHGNHAVQLLSVADRHVQTVAHAGTSLEIWR